MSESLPEHSSPRAPAELGERCLGVGDLDTSEVRAMAQTIRHVVWRELNQSVRSVYVMGSFARGEARRVASDLDVRVVIGSPVPEERSTEVEKTLKEDYGPDIVPAACGYLDPDITVLDPGEESPHVEVTA